jgi:tetratricopeptide (TPR) repeat protein
MRTRILNVLLPALTLAGLAGCHTASEVSTQARADANLRYNFMRAQVEYDQAKQSLETGQFDKAHKQIAAAIGQFPDSPAFHILQGRIYLETNRLELAARAFSTALEKCGGDAEAVDATLAKGVTGAGLGSRRAERQAEAHYYLGIVHQRWSDDAQAHTHYRAAFELQTDRADYLLAAAETLVELGDYDGATALVEPRLAYFEHNAAMRHLLGEIALLRDDPATAAQLYSEARLLNPDDATLLEELAFAQYAARQYPKCYDSIKELQRKPGNGVRTDLKRIEARCLTLMERTTEARNLYLELMRATPTDADMWVELGVLAWELGDYNRVAQSSVRIIALAPERFEGYMLKGVNEQQHGRLEQAIGLFREAVTRASAPGSPGAPGIPGAPGLPGSPGSPAGPGHSEVIVATAVPNLLLGRALEQQGQIDAALVAYGAAARADPSKVEARASLDRLAARAVTSVTSDAAHPD